MQNADKKILITDSSVLINFLNINRIDLLAFPGKFLITEHVVEEITIDFPEQQAALTSAINNAQLTIVKVDQEKELNLYNDLSKEGRLGSGECSAIACAVNRRLSLAMEDSRACKQALKIEPTIEIFRTQDIMIKLITDGILTVDEADAIKLEWLTKYRFALKFKSFSDIFCENK